MKGVVVVLLFCIGLLAPCVFSYMFTLEDYPISLYHRDSRLTTMLWFRPPYCLYELWTTGALEPSYAARQTATIEMQVKQEGDSNVYKAIERFPIPMCRPAKFQSLALGDHACEMGPVLACLNVTCLRAVLPGRKYSIRYLLYNQAQTPLATTGWSRHFRTLDMPRDYRTMDDGFGSHSAEMMVITALTSITMVLLLGATGLALIARPPSSLFSPDS